MKLPDLTSLKWESPRKDQAAGLRLVPRAEMGISGLTAVVSGKGGVGKTNVVANVGVAAAALGARVLVVDGDMGLSNLDVLMGLSPKQSVIDVVRGRCTLEEAIVQGPKGVRLLPAGAGRNDLGVFEAGGTLRLVDELQAVAGQYDLILLDAGSGIGKVVIDLALLATQVVLVAVPEPTSFADAYATCKTLWATKPTLPIDALVNCSDTPKEGRQVHEHLERMCERFLHKPLGLLGTLPRDRRLRDAVTHQRVVVEAYPNSSIAKAFVALAQQLIVAGKVRQKEERGSPRAHANPTTPLLTEHEKGATTGSL
ncbi:MAG: flagellar biosynthesis protein FlhG [Myxococcota bacterium]|jgi:flagellar biosynthesis protein FlhG